MPDEIKLPPANWPENWVSKGLVADIERYARAAVLADREGRQQCDTPAKGEYWLVQTPRAQALWHVEVLEVLSHSIRLKGRHSYYDMDGAWYAISDLRFVQLTTDAQRAKPGCGCQTCRPITLTDMRMVLCETCGNKRCPHATDHRHACTGSNEPGQPGSAYGDAQRAKGGAS